MFGFKSYLARAKYGFSLSIEAVKFTVRNFSVSLLYLLGLVLSLVPAGIAGGIVYLGLSIVDLYVVETSIAVATAVYMFFYFYFRAAIVYITGARMLGQSISLTSGLARVYRNKHLYTRWAVITAVVTLVRTWIKQKSDNRSVIRSISRVGWAVWSAATYFILPTLTFYSSDDTKVEAAQSVYMLRKRYIEISAAGIAKTLIMLLFFLIWIPSILFVTLTGVIGTAFLADWSALYGLGGALGTIGLFFGSIILGYFILNLFAVYITDVIRVALYLESEAPEDELNGFNTSVFDAEIPDEETVREDLIPDRVDEFFEDTTRDGEFELRM